LSSRLEEGKKGKGSDKGGDGTERKAREGKGTLTASYQSIKYGLLP
jgi:hypothetical protein